MWSSAPAGGSDDAKPPLDSWTSYPHHVAGDAYHRQVDGVWQTWHPYNGWGPATPATLKMLRKAEEEAALAALNVRWRPSTIQKTNASGGRAVVWCAFKTGGGPLVLGYAWARKPGDWRYEALSDAGSATPPGTASSKLDAARSLVEAGDRWLAAKAAQW